MEREILQQWRGLSARRRRGTAADFAGNVTANADGRVEFRMESSSANSPIKQTAV